MEKLDTEIERVEARSKVLENKVRSLKMEAINKKKAKDNRGNFTFISSIEL